MCREYDPLVKALSNRFGSHLKAVVLFGSRARGDASPDSDHDIFMVVDDLPVDPLSRTRLVRGCLQPLLVELPGAMNLHAKTPAEFQADLTPLYLDVCVDGICLSGAGYFEPLRKRGLAALSASGMKRKRVGGSLCWMLAEDGPKNWELTWEGYSERP